MSDTKALLLTDVVDSTRLSERLGDAAMAEVWAAHDRVARDLLPAWRGREIDKTDGMLLLFDAAVDAVAYAQAYHRGLAALPVPLRARAGLHVGPVLLRENAAADVARGAKPLEVDGLAKPMAARVMSLAGGGQTLVTADALAAMGEHVWAHASHGHWLMKGVSDPVELFEVGDDPAVFTVPADGEKVYRVVRRGERWVPVREIPNNLPPQTTSFVGRERELDEIKDRLGSARLITLLGMGGLGKTRLSLQVAAEALPQFPDGAWFVDLSPIRDPALVLAEAARVLDVQEDPGRPLLQALCAHLKSRRALLIIDNCEHLVQPAADLVHAVVQAAPQMRVLASSREPLRVPGEHAYPILPLPVPGRGDGAAALSRSAAVRLFVERARMHQPAFMLADADAPAMAELVGRLEGIPLALELAAARVRSLSVADINRRLTQRYKLLTGGSRVLQQRQQTLRALVDWSYDLLTPDEQTLLARLGVFAGGFGLADAEQVCGTEPIEAFDVVDLLGSLVEKSLVMLEDRPGGSRYRMLDTIREYACEKLAGTGGQATVAERHCAHYFALAKEGARGLDGAEEPRWIAFFEDERDNLRAATALAMGGGADPLIAVKLAVAMMGFWMLRGRVTEGRAVVREALALPAVQASDVAHAWGLYTGAALAGSQGEHAEARRMLEQCLALRRPLDNPVQTAATLSTLALSRLKAGDPAGARDSEREALAIFRAHDDRVGEAIGLLHLGQIALYEGDDGRAGDELEQALAVAREIGHHEVEAEGELALGEIAFHEGRLDDAAGRFERALAVCREASDMRGQANAVHWLGKVSLGHGDTATAAARLAEALRTFDDAGMREELVECLEDHAALALAASRAEAAAELAAAATQARQRLAVPHPPRAQRHWRALLAGLRESLGEARFEPAWARGRGWETGEAVRAALSGR